MPKYMIHATVVASKYIGEYEAETEERAIEMAWKDAHVSICHQCSGEVDEPQIDELHAEKVDQ
ncbi:hypothetical protein [Exiguobacterium sp. USCH10]|uniref:hypothetical protein n=1 Tax=Exiguobacterium sp. USCH10 TaxID=3024839 RepID=UPI0030AB22AD